MATIEGTNIAIISVLGIQGSELTQSTMEYYPSIGAGLGTPTDVIDAWRANTEANWLALVSEQWTMLEVRCSKKVAGIYTDGVRVVNTPGGVVGDVLPPLNTFSLVKIPDNAERDPPAGRLVGKGRVAISGVPESLQNNGFITSPGRVAADLLAESLEFFVDAVNTTTYTMYIQSLELPTDPTEEFAPVFDIAFNRLGTQLSRKR